MKAAAPRVQRHSWGTWTAHTACLAHMGSKSCQLHMLRQSCPPPATIAPPCCACAPQAGQHMRRRWRASCARGTSCSNSSRAPTGIASPPCSTRPRTGTPVPCGRSAPLLTHCSGSSFRLARSSAPALGSLQPHLRSHSLSERGVCIEGCPSRYSSADSLYVRRCCTRGRTPTARTTTGARPSCWPVRPACWALRQRGPRCQCS